MKVRPTREGKRFFLILVLILLAAFNTGNNLIYLIVSLMLSSMVLSLALSVINLRALELSVEPPGYVFAGAEVWMSFELSNRKKRAPSYSVRVKNPVLSGSHIVPFVPASGSAKGVMKAVFPRRGLGGMDGTAFETSFPFIFFDIAARAKTPVSFTVYPKLMDMGRFRHQAQAEGKAQSMLAGEEPKYIRQYREGDSLRRISWKATARQSKLMVVETAAELGEKFSIVLDGTGPAAPAAFEKAVSAAASAAKELLDGGYFVSLATSTCKIDSGAGAGHLRRILEYLAFVKEEPAWKGAIPEAGGMLVLKSSSSALNSSAASFKTVIHANRL